MTDDPDDTDAATDAGGPEAVDAAVQQFLVDADSAFAEYDDGYADADATLRVLRRHIDDLRDALGD